MMSSKTVPWRTYLLLAVILLLVGLVFSPCLKNQFVNWDDDAQVYKNTSIRSLHGENLKEIFTSRIGKLRVYIPLTVLSHAVEYHFVRYKPFLYHLDNLILHLAVVALVFVLARQLGLSVLGAGVAALLFGIHPIRVESVAWVTERKDVLYSVFYLMALCFYWQYLKVADGSSTKSSAIKFYALVVLFGVLSMLAKPMALSLPLILLLLDWFSRRPFDKYVWLEKIPIACFLGAIAWVTYVANARVPGEKMSEAILIWPWTFVFYIRQFFFPIFSVPIYRLPQPISIANYEYALSIAIFLLLVLAAIRFKRNRWFLFAFGYYFFSIFFLLRFDAAMDRNIVAERFMYLPSLGLCFLWGYYCDRLLGSAPKKFLVFKVFLSICLILLFTMFSFKSYRQCFVWRNGISLWYHQLRFYPKDPVAFNNLATILRDEPVFQRAEKRYRQVKELVKEGVDVNDLTDVYPAFLHVTLVNNLYQKAILNDLKYVDAHYNLGNLYKDIGEYRKALKYYGITINLDSTHKDAYFNIGKIFLELGDAQRAKEAFEHMIAQNPGDENIYLGVLMAYRDALRNSGNNPKYRKGLKEIFQQYAEVTSQHSANPSSFLNLGLFYREIKDAQRAIKALETALEINPKYVEAMVELANIYDDIGQTDKAILFYDKAISLRPEYDQAYLGLGVVYSRLQNYPKAKQMFQKVINLSSDNADAHFNLGFVYETEGKESAALEEYRKSIELNPQHSRAYYNLGNVYARIGENAKAIEAYQRSVSIDPGYMDPWANLSILSYRMKNFKEAVRYCDEARILGYEAPETYLKALEAYR